MDKHDLHKTKKLVLFGAGKILKLSVMQLIGTVHG